MANANVRNLIAMIAAPICFALSCVGASAQTLTVVTPMSHAESQRLADIRGGSPPVAGPTEVPLRPLPPQANYKNGGAGSGDTGGTAFDVALQTTPGPLISATTGTHFDGINVYQAGYIPSDNNIAVGPNHIVETVNSSYAIYTKTGGLLVGPNPIRSLWTGLSGACAANNGGDPIVQYDRAADRLAHHAAGQPLQSLLRMHRGF